MDVTFAESIELDIHFASGNIQFPEVLFKMIYPRIGISYSNRYDFRPKHVE